MEEATFSPAMTDKRAMRTALMIAIDTELALIDAYRDGFSGKVNENEEGVKIARRRITAFERVLDRYFGGKIDDPISRTKAVPLHEILASMNSEK